MRVQITGAVLYHQKTKAKHEKHSIDKRQQSTIQSHMIQCSQPNTKQRILTTTERTV